MTDSGALDGNFVNILKSLVLSGSVSHVTLAFGRSGEPYQPGGNIDAIRPPDIVAVMIFMARPAVPARPREAEDRPGGTLTPMAEGTVLE
jgi:hypothetical protein